MNLPFEIDIWQGEIAELEVDAIIIPASESLFMTGPVGAAVKRRAGDGVEREAVAQGPAAGGSVIVTSGGSLAAPWILHAVAVGHDLRADAARLSAALGAAFDAALAMDLRRLAMAPLGAERGVFPASQAAEALVGVLRARPDLAPIESLVVAVGSPGEAAAYRAAVEAVRASA
ncbi:MAG TPA: macro domain-containing protein [Candidatus Limnocylindria bacterium]|nr:macro domain-containing protein [Candidatus Limnocylindria bacterium]